MMRNAKNQALYKHFEIAIVWPEEFRKKEHKTYRAGPWKGFSALDMDTILDQIIENLDKNFPAWNFRLVPCGANKFNIVYAGLRSEEEQAA